MGAHAPKPFLAARRARIAERDARRAALERDPDVLRYREEKKLAAARHATNEPAIAVESAKQAFEKMESDADTQRTIGRNGRRRARPCKLPTPNETRRRSA